MNFIIVVLIDLGRMYSLVSRVPVGMAELRKKFETHVHSQGLSAIEKCGDTVINVRKLSDGCVPITCMYLHFGQIFFQAQPTFQVEKVLNVCSMDNTFIM